MNKIPPFIQKYLQKYAGPDRITELNINKNFSNIVVIPAICEYENIKTLLSSLVKLKPKYFSSTLFLFVVNNKEEISEEIKLDNKKTIALLKDIIHKKNKTNNALISSVHKSNINLGFIDASTEGRELPDKKAGVGLARKIGMDNALKLFDYTNSSKNILICLDADCRVSENYLSEIVETFNKEKINAAVIRYEHDIKKNNEETKAIICYEIFLRYYHLGLLYAGSPYSVPTIGSAMACDAESYVHVEGMNKRKAAEDFYFLEKLAKSYKIRQINKAVVYPAGRKSWRVPFGTGQRVERFLSNKKDEYVLFNPLSFDILKNWLSLFLSSAEDDPLSILNETKKISDNLYNFLNEQNFLNIITEIRKNSKTSRQFYNQKVKWFDGFKTLKLIHYLRDNIYSEINMFDALDELFEMIDINFENKRDKGTIPSMDIQKKYLIEMRNYIYGL